jgi:hypothetical protein
VGDAHEEIYRLIEESDRRSRDEQQPEDVRAFQRGVVAGLMQAGCTFADRTPPPHPLAILLNKALAVTDPERPPHSAILEIQLWWTCVHFTWGTHDLKYDGRHWVGLYPRKPHLTTTDPAEARAWLADALEAT